MNPERSRGQEGMKAANRDERGEQDKRPEIGQLPELGIRPVEHEISPDGVPNVDKNISEENINEWGLPIKPNKEEEKPN